MPAELCLLEVHKHIVSRIGDPLGVPLNQTPFSAPKVPSMQKRPQVCVSPINPDFFLERFRTAINRYSKNKRRSSSSPDELFFFSPEMDVGEWHAVLLCVSQCSASCPESCAGKRHVDVGPRGARQGQDRRPLPPPRDTWRRALRRVVGLRLEVRRGVGRGRNCWQKRALRLFGTPPKAHPPSLMVCPFLHPLLQLFHPGVRPSGEGCILSHRPLPFEPFEPLEVGHQGPKPKQKPRKSFHSSLGKHEPYRNKSEANPD